LEQGFYFSHSALSTPWNREAYLAMMLQPVLQRDMNDASRMIDQDGGHFEQRAFFASLIFLSLGYPCGQNGFTTLC
jgi:hypothetical protein